MAALNPNLDYDVTLIAEVAQALIERAGIERHNAKWVVPVEARPLITTKRGSPATRGSPAKRGSFGFHANLRRR